MSKPKFEVGQTVQVVTTVSKQVIVDSTVVLSVTHGGGVMIGGNIYYRDTYGYELTTMPKEMASGYYRIAENNLRRRPPPADESWEAMRDSMKSLERVT